MGMIECDVFDNNHIPLSPATCQLYLKQPVGPDTLEDTKATNSTGVCFLDTNRYFCFDFGGPYVYKIVVTYGTQTETADNIIANWNCTAPVQVVTFPSIGGCPAGCPTGYICQNNQCVPIPCTSDADCATGYHCVNGQCVVIPPSGCTSDSDCTAGYKCVNGTCVQSGGGNVLLAYVGIAGLAIGAAMLLTKPRSRPPAPVTQARRRRKAGRRRRR